MKIKKEELKKILEEHIYNLKKKWVDLDYSYKVNEQMKLNSETHDVGKLETYQAQIRSKKLVIEKMLDLMQKDL